jgi:hypothetical protein
MTLSKLVAKVNQLKPSEYDKDDITRWINQVEFLAFDQVIGHADPMDPKLRPLLRPPEGVLRPLSNGNEEVSTETAESTGDETVSSTEGYTVLPGVDNSHVRPPVPEPCPYRPYDYSIDAERELLIPDQFSDAYFYYVSAKIDFQNMEIDRYNAEAQAFENEFQQYAKWFRRTYRPKEIRHETTFTGYPYPEKTSPFRHIPWD